MTARTTLDNACEGKRATLGAVPEHRPDLGSCWLFAGALDEAGYGRARGGYAHRFAYEAAMGPIPDGLEIDHLCRVRGCINPAHLEAVSHRENMLRGETIAAKHAAKTHCPHGHEYTPENTYVRRTPWGTGRMCRACRKAA